MLFGRLLPREGDFFALFNKHADNIVQAALSFSQLVNNYDDLEARKTHTNEVDDAEHAADRTAIEIIHLLHKTFITPIERDQIHALANNMDDVADALQEAAQAMTLYDVNTLTPEIVALTDLGVKCCQWMKTAVEQLDKLSKKEVIVQTIKACKEISRLESEADKVGRDAISSLFRKEPDVRELIKLNSLYELLEEITDNCEDVADIIEGIILENS